MLILLCPFRTVTAEEGTKWTLKTDMPEARLFASTAVVGDKIYVIGGVNDSAKPQAQTFVYDPKLDKWEKKKEMPTPRQGASIAVIDKKIYVIAGLSTQGTVKTVEIYDTETDTWEKTTDYPNKEIWENTTSASVIDNKIYVVSYNEKKENNFYMYDPETKQWLAKKSFPKAEHGFLTSVIDGKLYVAGGYYYNNYYNNIFEYDPKTDQWNQKADLKDKVRLGSSAVYNDQFFIVGGETAGAKLTNKIQIYNPQKNTVSATTETFPVNIAGASSAIVGDSLYIIGGRNTAITSSRANSDFKPVYSIKLTDLKSTDDEKSNDDNSNSENPTNNNPTPPDDQDQSDQGDALLVITMVNGLQKEYQLSMKEVNSFLKWYKSKDAGEGPGFFEIDEHDNNKGPFESKKDYVVFKNILMFEVNKYKE
ncbi:DUF1668 domain-containing protein [Bacillus subtilis]|nr:DUF1668 domain-containing protein [Bacillus cereus]POO74605.1 DUF1668 domain-containing protein [Bacillus subtilis]